MPTSGRAFPGRSTSSTDRASWIPPLGATRWLRARSGGCAPSPCARRCPLTKTGYDRLGRVTSTFTLANSDDTVYADALTVTGDKVLSQQVTGYATDSNNVLVTGRIDRFHTDFGGGSTTGELDTNGDTLPLKFTAANVLGRIQISASWFDELDRVVDRVEYGTYAAADFNRSGLSVPARSDTALRTSYAFNDDGTLKDVTDPKGLVTRTFYDAMERRTKVVANYTDGTPGGGSNGDQDQTVLYGYADGLQTSITAEMPSGEDAQVTTYTFGTTKGVATGDSKIATGHLLQKVTYPDSGEVTFAYNAQSQRIWKKDQAGNVYETTFDDSGRETTRAVTTLASGFDGAVRRVVAEHDALGRVDTVTQHSHASNDAVVDQVKYTYDGWGNTTKFEQDRNSAVDGDQYTVQWSWAKATGGRNTLRCTDQTWPGGTQYSYFYRSSSSSLDSDTSRVTQIRSGTTPLTTYSYNGADRVVGTRYDEPEVMSKLHGSTTGQYPCLDRFNRPVVSRWTKDLSTDVDFFNVSVGWDANSNVTYQDDSVHAGFDAVYSNDDLNRLIVADEGTRSGGTITGRTRKQEWTLTQTGDWALDKLNLNGDSDWSDIDEWQDGRTHNEVNELTGRDLDNNSGTTSNNYTLLYDAVGQLTDDRKDYQYVWDAFGRLRYVKNRWLAPPNNVVAEYKYNGLGYRISYHEDTNNNGIATPADKWFHFAYDTRWRIVATFRADDATPKEQFIHHNAGLDGVGTGSYIDLVAWRDKDADADPDPWTSWITAPSGGLEERVYYCQNWRSDVVSIVGSNGSQAEQVRYSAYGVPFGMPAGDCDSDGDCNNGSTADSDQIQAWIGPPYQYDVRGDIDLNGVLDSADVSAVLGSLAGESLGRNKCSRIAVSSRRGFGGYEIDSALSSIAHVRFRSFSLERGVWISRDPAEYIDGLNLYQYSRGAGVSRIDPTGTETWAQCMARARQTWDACRSAARRTIAKWGRQTRGVVDAEERANAMDMLRDMYEDEKSRCDLRYSIDKLLCDNDTPGGEGGLPVPSPSPGKPNLGKMAPGHSGSPSTGGNQSHGPSSPGPNAPGVPNGPYEPRGSKPTFPDDFPKVLPFTPLWRRIVDALRNLEGCRFTVPIVPLFPGLPILLEGQRPSTDPDAFFV